MNRFFVRSLLLGVAILAIVAGCSSKEASRGAAMPVSDGGLRIVSIGDSTMADYDVATHPNQRGWGQMFRQFFVGNVTYVNAARNGRSTKSFYEEGLWNAVRAKLRAGDYVLIQFGHNDEKDDGIEGPSGRGTAAWAGYHDNLVRYIDETRALGAIPILVTPVVRRHFAAITLSPKALHNLTGNGTAVGDADYVASMRDVGAKKQVLVIDMTASTQRLVEQYGPDESKAAIYVSTDDTHLSPRGATLFAQLAAREMIEKGLFAGHLDASDRLANAPSGESRR